MKGNEQYEQRRRKETLKKRYYVVLYSVVFVCVECCIQIHIRIAGVHGVEQKQVAVGEAVFAVEKRSGK